MFDNDTDRQWEVFGRNNPYYGVLTEDRFRTTNLTDEHKESFFRSGYEHVEQVLTTIRKHIDPNYTIKRALDFGCGVGRVLLPLAEIAEHVVGADVSESMLNEAQKNCKARSIQNVSFVKTDDRLLLLEGNFDFIHSFIVFQHIPVKRGERIFQNLMTRLEDGGVCVTHFTYAKNYRLKKLAAWIKSYVPLSRNFVNLARRRHFFAPQMQMNIYDLNRLFFIMQKCGIFEFHGEYTDHGGELGMELYFRSLSKENGRKRKFA